VAVSGECILIGAPESDGQQDADDAGVTYVFLLDGDGGDTVEPPKPLQVRV
jgi:hypothetical protein